MNYKFSKRELLLFKILGAAIVMIGLFYGTSYVASEITKSKNLIFLEVNKFNNKKQLLAQIKALETNKTLETSPDDFLADLAKNNILFEQKGDEIFISGLSNLAALEIMTNIEDSNISVESFKFIVDDSTNITLSFKFNG
ncbi:MAG: hypothetical protein CBC72_002525 [Gammaproteobacteria bacterium TMED112]|nr:MAG: hypothetical protein CBC72_002525 [Gammaproteobacteria bacterium TMED112]